MPKFRKKPVEVDAFRWSGAVDGSWPTWMPDPQVVAQGETILWLPNGSVRINPGSYMDERSDLLIDTLEGTMRGEPGCWIIRGVKGEIYPCKPDIFEATYDAV